MASGLYNWSQTAATNSGSDSAINWAEGQAPSSVNDSARAMMAVIKKHDDDIAGAIVTGGTSTAYTVTSYSVFDTLAHMNGQVVAFTPHTTNGATVTLNVDGLGAKPLRSAPSVELLAGTLVEGSPYLALYNSSDQVWYLHGFYGNAYNIPLGGVLDYTGSTAPNSSFVLAYGQAISRTTYASYFSMVSTAFGVGDGSTTFNVPDLRGRVIAGKDDMGGSSAARLSTAMTSTTLGASGGAQTFTLTTANLPPYTPAGTNGSGSSVFNFNTSNANWSGGANATVTNITTSGGGSSVTAQFVNPTFTGTAQGGTSTPFSLAQPTFILNKILRII